MEGGESELLALAEHGFSTCEGNRSPTYRDVLFSWRERQGRPQSKLALKKNSQEPTQIAIILPDTASFMQLISPGLGRADGHVTHLSGLQAESVELPERPPEQLSQTRYPLPSYPYGASLSSALPRKADKAGTPFHREGKRSKVKQTRLNHSLEVRSRGSQDSRRAFGL